MIFLLCVPILPVSRGPREVRLSQEESLRQQAAIRAGFQALGLKALQESAEPLEGVSVPWSGHP